MALFLLVPAVYSGGVYEGALLPRLLVLQVGLLALWGFLVAGFTRERRNGSVFLLPIGCFLILAVASVLHSVNRVESVLQLSQYSCLLALPLVVHHSLGRISLERVVRFAPWAGVPVAVIGIAQYLGLGFSSIPSSANPSATFFHRNAAAEYLIAIVPLAWVGLRLARTQSAAICHGGLLVLLITFLTYTRARGAWLGLAAATLAVLLLDRVSRPCTPIPPRRRGHGLRITLAVTAIGLTAVLAGLPDDIQNPGNQQFDEKKADILSTISSILAEGGDRGRLRMWTHTLRMIYEHPLGVGIGNWQYLFPWYAKGDQVNVIASPTRPHNDYLWIASELGLLGLAAYFWVLVSAGRTVWRLLQTTDQTTRMLTLGFAAVLCGHMVDGVFNFPRERISAALCFWFALGGLSILRAETEGSTSSAGSRFCWLRSAIVLCGIPLVACAIVITLVRLDYDRHHLTVHAAERRGEWTTVKHQATQALKHGVLRANTAIALGRALSREGDLPGARQAYEAALAAHPNSLNAYNNLATVLRRMGDPAAAVQALKAALELLPGFAEAQNNLGLAYRDLGRLDESASALRVAASALPGIPDVHCNLGEVYRMQGDIAAARESYSRALSATPGFARALRALGTLGKIGSPPNAPLRHYAR